MTIGKRLKEIRKDLGFSQEKFANELSIHLRSYVSYEHEQRSLPENVLRKIRELGYSLDWLFGAEGRMKTMGLANDVSHPLYVTKTPIPIIDNHIGDPDFLIKHKDNYDNFMWPMLDRDPYAYALKVKTLNDESLAAKYSPERLIIVSPIENKMNDDRVIVKLKDGSILFRIIQYSGNEVKLKSIKPDVPEITVSLDKIVFAHKVILIK